MHAYLIIGKSGEENEREARNLSKKLGAKIIPYTINKIEDVRELGKITSLSMEEKSLIFAEDIDKATDEALNAFLKTLEEPQENLYFALTTSSARKVLPTIVSRCTIIKVGMGESEIKNESELEKFLTLSVGKKFIFIDKIKDRKEAIDFVENLVLFTHRKLHSKDVKYEVLARQLEVLEKTLSGLNSNGNVNLQLSLMAINI